MTFPESIKTILRKMTDRSNAAIENPFPEDDGQMQADAESALAWVEAMQKNEDKYAKTYTSAQALFDDILKDAQQPSDDGRDYGLHEAVSTLEALGYTYCGGEAWNPPVTLEPLYSTRLDAKRFKRLEKMYSGADFYYGIEEKPVLIFNLPKTCSVSSSLGWVIDEIEKAAS